MNNICSRYKYRIPSANKCKYIIDRNLESYGVESHDLKEPCRKANVDNCTSLHPYEYIFPLWADS